jgi:hypothetical protein
MISTLDLSSGFQQFVIAARSRYNDVRVAGDRGWGEMAGLLCVFCRPKEQVAMALIP